MRATRSRARQICATLLLALGLAACADQEGPPAASPASPIVLQGPKGPIVIWASKGSPVEPAPRVPSAAADEFWQKMMSLIVAETGYITKNAFEQTFGVEFESNEFHENGSVHETRRGDGKVLNAELSLRVEGAWTAGGGVGPGSLLTARWAPDAFGDFKQGECIDSEQARSDLLGSGWTGGIPVFEPGRGLHANLGKRVGDREAWIRLNYFAPYGKPFRCTVGILVGSQLRKPGSAK